MISSGMRSVLFSSPLRSLPTAAAVRPGHGWTASASLWRKARWAASCFIVVTSDAAEEMGPLFHWSNKAARSSRVTAESRDLPSLPRSQVVHHGTYPGQLLRGPRDLHGFHGRDTHVADGFLADGPGNEGAQVPDHVPDARPSAGRGGGVPPRSSNRDELLQADVPPMSACPLHHGRTLDRQVVVPRP